MDFLSTVGLRLPCPVGFAFSVVARVLCAVSPATAVWLGSRSHCVNMVKGRGTTASTVLSCRLFHTHLCRVGRRRTQVDTCVGVGGCLSVLVGFFFWVVNGEKKKDGDGGKTWKVNRTYIYVALQFILVILSSYPTYCTKKKKVQGFPFLSKGSKAVRSSSSSRVDDQYLVLNGVQTRGTIPEPQSSDRCDSIPLAELCLYVAHRFFQQTLVFFGDSTIDRYVDYIAQPETDFVSP